jgi:hypothetical protein
MPSENASLRTAKATSRSKSLPQRRIAVAVAETYRRLDEAFELLFGRERLGDREAPYHNRPCLNAVTTATF